MAIQMELYELFIHVWIVFLYFNPRSRVGSDKDIFRENTWCYKFQSTLPRGERRGKRACQAAGRDFNPRSRVGSDQSNFKFSATKYKFQSTLPRGERPHNQ